MCTCNSFLTPVLNALIPAHSGRIGGQKHDNDLRLHGGVQAGDVGQQTQSLLD